MMEHSPVGSCGERGLVLEQAAVTFVEALGRLGEGFLFAIGILVILAGVAIKAMPMVDGWQNRRIDIEEQREKRKSDEAEARAQRDRERSEMEGRWLAQYEHATHVQEQSNVVVEGMREQTMLLNQTLTDSKNRSQQMSQTVETVSQQVQEIHQEIFDKDK